MRERLAERQYAGFDEMLGSLAENMRAYDRTQGEIAPLREEVFEREAALANLSLLVPVEAQPAGVALDALKLIIAKRKIQALNNRLDDNYDHIGIAFGLRFTRELSKKKIEIEALNSDYPIGVLRSVYRNRTEFIGEEVDSAKGRFERIFLDSKDGGALQIRKRNRIFQAYPLIDRHNDYQPLYSIKIAD